MIVCIAALVVKKSIRKDFLIQKLPKQVAKTEAEFPNECDDLQGKRMKIFISSKKIDIWNKLEILLGLNLSRHTDTLTETSNLIDELYKKGGIENGQQHRNALDRFYTK